MEKLSLFTIPFVGLKEGNHEFLFYIDNKFFKSLDYKDFNQAKFQISLELTKKVAMLELFFKAKGLVNLPCDVSTELFDLKVDTSFKMLVKFGDVTENVSDEILIIPHGSYEINVSQFIYEMIILAIPLKKTHPGIEDGTLQSEIIDKLKELEPKEDQFPGSVDPRWDKLKDLI
jgi:uncharacterized metal-binding protein YceD (DUF177 family)